MTPAITLTPSEKAIAERQCDGCVYWNWFKGCYWPGNVHNRRSDDLPVKDCCRFKSGLRSV